MSEIVITCVGCGKTETVDDRPESIRNKKCKTCGGAMIVKRHPGNSSNA
ncbi:rRNA maturation endonuclease Nob1 [Edaphobacter lichenicola]|jgi:rRNA maturation endonuclease Nob1|uniref:rRNA maturation endonuclease Nob1 n=1 Tax=Tunturiibacter gelidiferens TaxID=3069689 RepID=A0A9X0QHK0_9BACT|nr:rRNA maturation endonuclease Nob1 [Edaphobacter lichenicola]